MNKAQRKTLQDLTDQLQTIKEIVDDLQQQEQDKFDNLSEGLQQAENGQKLETAADALADVASEIESVIDHIGEVIE